MRPMIQLLSPIRTHTVSAVKTVDGVGGRMPVGLA